MGGIRPLYNTNKHFFFYLLVYWWEIWNMRGDDLHNIYLLLFSYLIWNQFNSVFWRFFEQLFNTHNYHFVQKPFPKKKTMFILDIQCDLNQFKFQFLDTLCTGGIRILASHTDEKDTQICKSQIQQEYMYISHSL